MNLYLHNTLTKSKELFVPINSDMVGIYSCGPTVYSTQHIGNLRAAFVVDLLKNTLKHVCGYNTKHIMNITDVGHLTGDNEGDADHGEDRMEKGARNEGITAWDVADRFIDIYIRDLESLGIDKFEIVEPKTYKEAGVSRNLMPRATKHIEQQIAMVQELEAKGYTYIIPGDGVYMDTSKMSDYGVLVGKKHLEGIQSGARVDDDGKINPTDFALWKFNMTGKKRDMERDSPWGVGFPGWHIECSAMSMEYLGDQIDIHTGGVEHIPVHHTNEIAQAECSHGHHPWVNYWVHYQHLMMNGQKLAKSTSNVAFMSDILAKGYSGQDLRMFYLQTHYRSFQDFTWEGLEQSHLALDNIKRSLNFLAQRGETAIQESEKYNYKGKIYSELLNDLETNEGKIALISITTSLLQDLDTPVFMSTFFKIIKDIRNIRAHGIEKNSLFFDDLNRIVYFLDQNILKLGLFEYLVEQGRDAVQTPADIQALADQRRQAKLDKDYSKADEIRGQLTQLGWSMLDGKDGYELEKI